MWAAGGHAISFVASQLKSIAATDSPTRLNRRFDDVASCAPRKGRSAPRRLHLDGKDLTPLPLLERKARLRALLSPY
jgi:hypothetical protein